MIWTSMLRRMLKNVFPPASNQLHAFIADVIDFGLL